MSEGLPQVLVELRRRQLAKLPTATLRAFYATLPGRTRQLANASLLSNAALIDIIIWTEFLDWHRVGGRGRAAG